MNFDFFQFCRNVNKSEQHGLTKTEEIAKGQFSNLPENGQKNSTSVL